jgi:hypothetical protein
MMLNFVKEGLRDMGTGDPSRVVIGLFAVAIFGRAVSSALQNLRTFDKPAFDAWYAPWEQAMRADEICQFFYSLRSAFLKDIEPTVAVLLSPAGTTGEAVVDMPLPKSHRGFPIHVVSLLQAATLYVTYLEEMAASFTPLIMEVQERWHAAQGD